MPNFCTRSAGMCKFVITADPRRVQAWHDMQPVESGWIASTMLLAALVGGFEAPWLGSQNTDGKAPVPSGFRALRTWGGARFEEPLNEATSFLTGR